MTDRHAWAASMVAAAPGEHLLEIGCGAGQAAQIVLRDLSPRGTLRAIDRSAAAVRQASARCDSEIADGRLRVEQLELATLTAPDGFFDGAWAMNVNMFWTADPATELGLLRRVIRPRGRLLLLWDVGPTTVGKLKPLAGHLMASGFDSVQQAGTEDGIVVRASTPAR